jgi:hypothetical protein
MISLFLLQFVFSTAVPMHIYIYSRVMRFLETVPDEIEAEHRAECESTEFCHCCPELTLLWDGEAKVKLTIDETGLGVRYWQRREGKPQVRRGLLN